MARLNRLRSRSEGNALVEFAMVLPLLLLVIAGIVDFGFTFQRYEVVTNAAREGARIAVLPGYTTADVQARVRTYIEEGLNMSTAQVNAAIGTPLLEAVSITPAGGMTFNAARVTVTFTHNYLLLGPIVNLATGGSFGTQVTLTARSTMRLETF
jgi:Flp pilus assembly protein TadG